MKSTQLSRDLVRVALTLAAFYMLSVTELADAGAATERLFETLFDHHNKYVIPVENETDSLTVYIGFKLAQIVDLDIQRELLQSNLWITMTWTDYKMKWNPDEYNGIESLVIPESVIWKPTIMLENRVITGQDNQEFFRVRLHNSGLVELLRIGQFSSSCDIDVQWFPFDEQTCKMVFVSWYHENELVLLHQESLYDPNDSTEEGEWKIIETTTNATSSKKVTSFSHQLAVLSVRLRRQPLYYMTNLVLPCALIACLAMLTFILPPDGGDKIGLSITVLLTLTVFLMLVGAEIPPTPHTVPIIEIYVILLMLLCTLSVVAACFVLRFYNPTPSVYKMPKWIRIVFCDWLAWMLWVRKPGVKQSFRDLIRKSRKDRHAAKTDGNDEEKHDLKRNDDTPSSSALKSATSSDGQNVQQLLAIYEELRLLTDKVKRQAVETELADEWKFAATVLDRLCLWLFILCITIGSLVVYTRKPFHED